MKHKMKYSMPVGTSSILLIFMTLCLICFATLSLANANADYRLSKKLADHTSAYYQAANNCIRHICKVKIPLPIMILPGDVRFLVIFEFLMSSPCM